MTKLTEGGYEFLARITKWEDEVTRIGNDAIAGPLRGYGQAFGKWKPIAETLEVAGLCQISGYADWYKEGAWTVVPTPAGRAALEARDAG